MTTCPADLLMHTLQGSPLGHMAAILSTLSMACGTQQSPQQFNQALLSQPALLRPLHTIITTFLETPTAAETASSVDIALYEALADALAPNSQQEEQFPGAGSTAMESNALSSAGRAQVLQQQMAQMVLGTFVPRYLERCAPRCIRCVQKWHIWHKLTHTLANQLINTQFQQATSLVTDKAQHGAAVFSIPLYAQQNRQRCMASTVNINIAVAMLYTIGC